MQKNFLYYLMPSITIGALGTFIMVPVTTYYLDPKDFGIVAIISAITMPIGPLASTGVTWVLAGNYYKIDEKERKVLMFNILFLDFALKLFWVLIFWASASLLLPIIIKDFESRYQFYFRLSLISTLLTTFWPSISYHIVLQEKGHVHATFEILQWVGGALVTIVCLTILKLSTVTLFLSSLASGMISFVACLWYIRSYVTPKISRKWFHEIFAVGIPSIPTNLFEIITNISDRYFIQRWINLSQLGIYSHSESYKSIFNMSNKAFSRTFNPLVLQTFSNSLDSKDLEEKLRKWYGLLGVAGIFITLFSYEVVNILTNGKFIAAAPLVPIWFTLLLSFTYGMPYTQYLSVHKKNLFMMYSGISIGAGFIGITAFCIFKFGILGATFAIVLSNFAIQVSRRIYARMLGCEKIGGYYFFSIIVVILGTYIANSLINFNIYEKIIGFIIATILLVNSYGLNGIIKENYQKISAYLAGLSKENYLD